MIYSSGGRWPIPPDIPPLLERTFNDIASPGDGWSGVERVAIASIARSGPRSDSNSSLPKAGVDAAHLVASSPSAVNEPWVREKLSAIGEIRYVELVGIVAALAAVDTVTVMLGLGVEPLPGPLAGELLPARENPGLNRRSSWVSTSGPPGPVNAISAAPRTRITVMRLLQRLYVPESELDDTGPVRGLTREQVELVALKVSHSNECFY